MCDDEVIFSCNSLSVKVRTLTATDKEFGSPRPPTHTHTLVFLACLMIREKLLIVFDWDEGEAGSDV